MKTTTTWLTLIATLTLVWALPACNDEKLPSPIMEMTVAESLDWNAPPTLRCAKDCVEAQANFKQMLKAAALLRLEENRRNHMSWHGGGPEMNAAMEDGAAAPGSAKGTQESGASDYSETNVQVDGVDEADLVKTDGNLLYTLSGQDLVIVDAWPAESMHEVGRVTLTGTPGSFFLHGKQLIVLSTSSYHDLTPEQKSTSDEKDSYVYNWMPMTILTVIDATDPAAPVTVREEAYEGYLMSSRRIGDRAYLVQRDYGWKWSQGLDYWADVDWNASENEVNAAYVKLAKENVAYIDSLDLATVMPKRYALTPSGKLDLDSAAPVAACDSIFSSPVHSGSGLLSVVTVQLDGDGVTGSAVLGDWGTIYASLDALYVATTNWSYAWWWDEEDDKPSITTHIHKFALDPTTGIASYTASGNVPGYVLNQFSMDEHEGRLRVATTAPDWWWWGNDSDNDSESFVTVLEEQSGALKKIGQVSGLGKGEQIYSVRFVGDKGYVVTFRQVDPLYVLDLSKPSKPEVTGELKIPGFSSYMHPMDDSHLLTIGRDGTEEGTITGLQFQIFDVSDPANPAQVAKTTLGSGDGWSSWMWSEAMWDHHAFVYFAARGLLAVPVSGWEYDESMGYGTYHTNLQLFKVDVADGVTPMGSVSHLDMLGPIPEVKDDYCYWDLGYWFNQVAQIRRGVFMDDMLYSVSPLGIKAHSTLDLAAGPLSQTILMDTDDLDLQELFGDGYCW